jgi:outer membrane protein OmpA-like peptidoglycan-associated protein
MWIPTGHDESYAGEPFRIEPRIALDYHSERLVFVVNAGYRVRSTARVVNTELDDQVTLGVGADLQVVGGFGLLGMIDSRLNVLADELGDDSVDTELLFGARFAAGGFRAQLGAGPSVSQAFTAPDYRVFAGLSYAHEPTPAAPPPPQPALETDGDRDGVPDAQDRCPREAEDDDGFQDDDGCPDRDDDGDGIADAADSCPREVGVAEERGCPARPAPAPEPEPAPAPVTAPPPATVELDQVVRFEKNRFALSAEQDSALDELAQQLKEHPDARPVVIEGHADDRGSAALNERLAQGRAESVRNALIKRGVDPKRLQARGLGASRPIASNDSEESRAQNRRVELRVERAAP